jgi:hypothetical protein
LTPAFGTLHFPFFQAVRQSGGPSLVASYEIDSDACRPELREFGHFSIRKEFTMLPIRRCFLGTLAVLVVAVPSAFADDPTLYDAITSSTLQGTQYQIKGSVAAKNLPADTMTVQFSIEFQKLNTTTMTWQTQNPPAGAGGFTTPRADHTASYETPWTNFSPAQGSQWRIYVTGYYVSNTGQHNFAPIASPGITPRP